MKAYHDQSSDTISFDNTGTVNRHMPQIQVALVLVSATINVLFADQYGTVEILLWTILGRFCALFLFWSFFIHKEHKLYFYLKDIKKIYVTSFLGFGTFKLVTQDGRKNSLFTVWPGYQTDDLTAVLTALNVPIDF
ncbi:hypothetical protein DN752_11895 [Echinicola strongylocentroti]|uniref:Uncharacterized protein n=1 Tax=Echinicola strongylocentroti TaxID=1795355 RepID=A0A2Z4IJR6_9BACT|nr:hypothetical protein [Echinicola strongylocentroti]AWW30768.1 hypothetical protein DN752_11895 [Echinicola strongylocentroti]